MNERIQELEDQALKECDAANERGIDQYSKRLAELIVKETMQVVANQLPSNQYLDVAHAVIEHYKDADVI